MPRKKTPKSDDGTDLIPSLSVCQTETDCEVCSESCGTDFEAKCDPKNDEVKEIDFQEATAKKHEIPKEISEKSVENAELESLRLKVADLEVKVSELQTKVDKADKEEKSKETEASQPSMNDNFDQIVATAVAEAMQQERAWVNSQILLKLAQARR